MRISSSSHLDPSDFSDSSLLDNVVIFPDGTVTWVTASATPSEVIPTAACEVVPEWYLLPAEWLPQPQPPDIFITAPEFAPVRALKSTGRF